MKKRSKKIVLLLLCFTLILSVISSQIAQAERVYGTGALRTYASDSRTNNFGDTTVSPPLGLSWEYTNVSSVPIEQGLALTNYRLYFGENNRIRGINNQTGVSDSTVADYLVGNPFLKSFNSSKYGNVSTAVEVYPTDYGSELFFGTDKGFIGRMDGFSLNSQSGEQNFTFSPSAADGSSNYFGGAIKVFGKTSHKSYVAAASNYRLHFLKSSSMDRMWYYDIDDIPNSSYKSSDRFSGITSIDKPTDTGDLFVTTDQGNSESYGLIFKDSNKNLGEWTVKNPSILIKYDSGIPKPAAYDENSRRIYAVDQSGKLYIHNVNGYNIGNSPLYLGNSITRGYESVGGVALDSEYVFASTETSSLGTSRGTITRFTLPTPSNSNKRTYVHNAKITTTPILLNGFLYFGDNSGKVYALDPINMEPIEWYKDENGTSHLYYQAGNVSIDYLLGADNHLISASKSGIYAFKGRPDFTVSQVNTGAKALHAHRINFTGKTPPSITASVKISNEGSFDYNVYNDFNGINHQNAEMFLKHLDTNATLQTSKDITFQDSAFFEKYKSEDTLFAANKQFFQVPAEGSANYSVPLSFSTEGKYEYSVSSDYLSEQKEFNELNNSKSSVFDVVDMNPPVVSANKNLYKTGESVIYNLSKSQLYSYTNYELTVAGPNNTIAFNSKGTNFPSTLSNNNTNTPGTYRYKLDIYNRYGDKLSSVEKTFQVERGNLPPVADFRFNKINYTIDDIMSITSLATDPDNDPLVHEYTITGPDSKQSLKSEVNPNISNLIRGQYRVVQKVTDPYGESDSITKYVSVINRPPVAKFITDKSNYRTDESIKITSQAVDPDKDVLSHNYEITKPDGSKISSSINNPSISSLEPGTYQIRQVVEDPYGSQDTYQSSVTVTNANRPPVAKFVTNKASYLNGEQINITSQATDPDGDAISHLYEITRPDGTKYTSTSVNPSISNAAVGTYQIKQTVTDPAGLSDSFSGSVQVLQRNNPPIARFVTDKTTYYKDESIRITSQASDPDGDSLIHSYEITRPDGTKFNSSQVNPVIANAIRGKYVIKQTVTDPFGAADTYESEVNVVNRPPVAKFVTDKSSYTINESIKIVSQATDPDNDSITHFYEITKPDGTRVTSSQVNPTISTPLIRGKYFIRQVVTDTYGASDSYQVEVNVVNRPPVAKFVTDKSSYLSNETINITSQASDPDNDSLVHLYEITKPNGEKITSSQSNPTISNAIRGIYTIKQTVTDPFGASSTFTLAVNVGNRPPVAKFVTNKTSYINGETISVTSQATDPEGDALTHLYEVTKPDGSKITSSQANFSITNAARGSYLIKQTVTDPYGASDTYQSTVSVINRPPNAAFVTDKASYYSKETIKITSQATDPDGDTLTYLYEITKPDGSKTTSTEVNPSILNAVRGNYLIKQTVTDPYGASDTYQTTVSVINRPPVANFVSDKAFYYKFEPVKITSQATDPDGDTLTHSYTVKGPDGISKSYSTKDFQFNGDIQGIYEIKQVVTDPFGASDSITHNVEVKLRPVILNGFVKHTPEWTEKHKQLGNSTEKFYSGEVFVLEAEVSPYPIRSVSVLMKGKLENNTNYTKSIVLNPENPRLYINELYDEKFIATGTRLKTGEYPSFIFTVEYIDGQILQDIVDVQIIGDIYSTLKFHRKY